MPRGGYRPNAGRKSNADIKTIRAQIDTLVSQADWQEIIQALVARAKEGDARAILLLFSYRFGSPNAQIAPEHDVKPIKVIQYVGDNLSYNPAQLQDQND